MSKLTFVGISDEQFIGYMSRNYDKKIVKRAKRYIQESDTECNIVILIPRFILENCYMFTSDQIDNICDDIADTFELDRNDWHVFTTG